MKLIYEKYILDNSHDVTLENGAKHRCFDVTKLSEVPSIDVIPVDAIEKLCCKYIHDARDIDESGTTNLDRIALAIELRSRANALGDLLLMYGYDTLYMETH